MSVFHNNIAKAASQETTTLRTSGFSLLKTDAARSMRHRRHGDNAAPVLAINMAAYRATNRVIPSGRSPSPKVCAQRQPNDNMQPQ
jgi:hypothetical protein